MTITESAHIKLEELLGRSQNEGKLLRVISNGFG